MLNDLIKLASEGFHILIAAFLALGWIISPAIHAPVCAGVLVHWLMNKNRCVMSEGYEDNNGFSTGVLKKVGIDISTNETLKTVLPYVLVIIPAILSVVLGMKGIELVPQIVKVTMSHIAMIAPFGLVLGKLFGAARDGVKEGLAMASESVRSGETAPEATA